MAAVAALEVDELAAVVPDLDHGHGVVVWGAQVVDLSHDGDQTIVLASSVDVPRLQHGDVRLLVVDHPHAVPVGEGRFVGQTGESWFEELSVESCAHPLTLVKLRSAGHTQSDGGDLTSTNT